MYSALNIINKIFLYTIILCLTLSLQAKDYGSIIVSEVVSVYDGDTFRVNLKTFPAIVGDSISIRVNGIDTPEIRGKYEAEKALAIQAREFVRDKLSTDSMIVLKNIQRGKYFRIVADVYVDGKNLTDMLIQAQLGVKYNGGTKVKDWCK